MEVYFQTYINFKENNLARLFLMAEFVYNNVKNASTSYMLFKLNYKYYIRILYKKNLNPRSKFKAVDKIAGKLKNFIETC